MLVGMLIYARDTTLAAVAGLSVMQLDHLHDDASNSIGATRALRRRGAQQPKLAGVIRAKPGSGDTLAIRIALRMTPGWHVGSSHPGVIGVPSRVQWTLPGGWRVAEERWATPTQDIVGKDTSFVYAEPFAIDVSLVRPPQSHGGSVQAVLSYGICRDVCIPGRITLTSNVP